MDRHFWHALIMREPADPLHCRGYADWLEEQGQLPEARALRWMASTGKHPGHRTYYRRTAYGPVSVPLNLSWCWRLKDAQEPDLADVGPECELPRPLFVAIAGTLLKGHIYYPSWLHAINDLVEGLEVIRAIMEATQ